MRKITEVEEYYMDSGWLQSPCQACKRLKKLGDQSGGNSSCEAYPDGIPNIIFRGAYDHRVPFKGDNMKLFVPYIEKILDGKKYTIGWMGVLE